jgi:hypothetical protein
MGMFSFLIDVAFDAALISGFSAALKRHTGIRFAVLLLFSYFLRHIAVALT